MNFFKGVISYVSNYIVLALIVLKKITFDANVVNALDLSRPFGTSLNKPPNIPSGSYRMKKQI